MECLIFPKLEENGSVYKRCYQRFHCLKAEMGRLYSKSAVKEAIYSFECLITDLLCFQEVVEKNLKKQQQQQRGGAESVDSSASSNLDLFANDELG